MKSKCPACDVGLGNVLEVPRRINTTFESERRSRDGLVQPEFDGFVECPPVRGISTGRDYLFEY